MIEKKDIKFVYFGTPDFSVIVLEELKKEGFIPSLVVTAKDKPVGRKHIITPPPVKKWAKENNIPYLQPKHPSEITETLSQKTWDLFIIASYGYIVNQKLLDIPKYGVLNVHTSLLPKYRGASPIESVILNKEKETGSTIMKMTLGMDEGPILKQSLIQLNKNITKPELFEILAHDGGRLLAKTIYPWINGETKEQEQNHKNASYCKKIIKADANITNDNDEIRDAKYRAYHGWPGSFIMDKEIRLKITKAHMEQDKFIIDMVIPAGKKEISYQQYLKNKK